jgi:guanyl-specific ribonuclease Sa
MVSVGSIEAVWRPVRTSEIGPANDALRKMRESVLAKSELLSTEGFTARGHTVTVALMSTDPGGAMAAAQSSSFGTMEASSLTRQANQVWDKIKQDIPSEYRTELKNIVQELSARVDFVSSGKAPRAKTSYQSLQASPLAQQSRHIVTQIARNIPVDRRDSLRVFDALADRVEFAGSGYPSNALKSSSGGASPTRRRSSTSRRKSRPSPTAQFSSQSQS